MPKTPKAYYTFKVTKVDEEKGVVQEVECTKWEMDEPTQTYKVKPFVTWMGCTCPAYKKCKHQTCVEELFESRRIEAPWKWRWDEVNGWTELDDIADLGEV